MATLTSLIASIRAIIRNDATLDPEITSRINDAVCAIAIGIILPSQDKKIQLSPPLPELYKSDTVATTVDAYVALPPDYQRNVFYVVNAAGSQIAALESGTYYSFDLFLNNVAKPGLSEAGSINMVAIKGSNIYYQGIPADSENMTLHYYRKPVDMSGVDDTPDGIPFQFQTPLIKHYVCRDIFGDILEGETKGRFIYHDNQFTKVLVEMTDFINSNDAPYLGDSL